MSDKGEVSVKEGNDERSGLSRSNDEFILCEGVAIAVGFS